MRSVGRYEILREIGRGGMAIVYAARQPDLDRQVALKELSSFHANSIEFAHRFLRESRLAGSLNHPNIVTGHDRGHAFVHGARAGHRRRDRTLDRLVLGRDPHLRAHPR